jgi:serine/threonine-protein kinase
VDARADIWALGVTLYELISGKQPFRGQSHADLVSQVLNATPDELETPLAVALPAGLQRVVARCLEKQRDRRYGDAAELAAALAPFGSEDARLSLSRVAGLSRPRVSTPTSMTRGFPNDDPTLPVAIEPPSPPPQSAGTSGVRKVVSGPGSRRLRLELGGVAAVAILGSAIWLGLRESKPNALASSPSAAIRTATLQATPPAALAPIAPIQTDTGVVNTETTPPSKALAPTAQPPSKPHKHALTSVANAQTPSPIVSTETKPPAAESTAGDLGSSALIERLIEQRH